MEMMYRAKTIHIVQHNLMDVDISLGLNVHIQKRITLDGLPSVIEDAGLADQAQHCLIVLLGVGGKPIVVTLPENAEYKSVVPAMVFLQGQALNEAWAADYEGEAHISVNAFMAWLHTRNYPVDEVRHQLQARKRGPDGSKTSDTPD